MIIKIRNLKWYFPTHDVIPSVDFEENQKIGKLNSVVEASTDYRSLVIFSNSALEDDPLPLNLYTLCKCMCFCISVFICVFVFLDLWYFSTLWVYEGSIALHSSHVRLQKSPSIKQQRQWQATTPHFVFLYIIKCKKGHSLSSPWNWTYCLAIALNIHI